MPLKLIPSIPMPHSIQHYTDIITNNRHKNVTNSNDLVRNRTGHSKQPEHNQCGKRQRQIREHGIRSSQAHCRDEHHHPDFPKNANASHVETRSIIQDEFFWSIHFQDSLQNICDVSAHAGMNIIANLPLVYRSILRYNHTSILSNITHTS